MLKISSYKMQEIRKAIETGDEQKVLQFIQNGTMFDSINILSDSPLHIAARSMHANIVRILLQNGANVNWHKSSDTPLHCAIKPKNNDVIQLLIQHGADVNFKNMLGYTPLHMAAIRTKDSNIAFMLIKNGANVHTKDLICRTPLHYAIQYKKIDILNMLIDFGATINIDNSHFSCLELALQSHNDEVLWTILENGANINGNVNVKDRNLNNKLFSALQFCDQTNDLLCKNIVWTHLVKLKSLNQYINDQNLLDMETNMLLNKRNYERDISNMKSVSFNENHNITVYDILTKSMNQLSNYLMNKRLRDELQMYDFSEQFSVYNTTLKYRLKVANRNTKLSKSSFKVISNIISKDGHIPDLIIYKILSNFNRSEIKEFMRSYNHYMSADYKYCDDYLFNMRERLFACARSKIRNNV